MGGLSIRANLNPLLSTDVQQPGFNCGSVMQLQCPGHPPYSTYVDDCTDNGVLGRCVAYIGRRPAPSRNYNTARVVVQALRRCHAEPLHGLHWLPVQQRIKYKLAVLT